MLSRTNSLPNIFQQNSKAALETVGFESDILSHQTTGDLDTSEASGRRRGGAEHLEPAGLVTDFVSILLVFYYQ